MVGKMSGKIAFLINSLTSGGAEKVATEIVNKLYDKYGITIISIENDKFYELKKGIRFITMSQLRRYSNPAIKCLMFPIIAYKLIKYIKKEDPKVLVSFLEVSNFLGIVVSKVLKKPIVISVHTNPEIQYKNGFLSHLIKKLIKYLYPKSDKIVVVSKALKNILIKKYDIHNELIQVIYNPINISEIHKLSNEPLDETHQKIFKNSFVFINIGRLTEAKGQWFLIRSFKKVVEKHPNAKLIILGEGELRNKLQELIDKLNLQNNVFLLGAQKNPYKFLKNSDCFVFSSLWEGFGIVLIEALALNIPIISTDCSVGPREVLCPELNIERSIEYPHYGKYGILNKTFRNIDCNNMDKIIAKSLSNEEIMFAKLMIEILENDDLRKKYSFGIERANDFDIEKISERWIDVIKSL